MPITQEQARDIAAACTAAWNTGSTQAVAAFYAPDGGIVINNGTPWVNREGVAQMAAGFFADVPNLLLTCDAVRVAGDHIAYFWTFTGTHSGSGNPLNIVGWKEWDMNADLKVQSSRGGLTRMNMPVRPRSARVPRAAPSPDNAAASPRPCPP